MLEINKIENNCLLGEVILPSSKSISHRYLIINAVAENELIISSLSDSNDTKLLQNALQDNADIIDFEDAGSPMRFFLAYAALKNITSVITGNDGLKSRPIAPLVDALRQLGCKIEYLDKDGFVPVRIEKGIDVSKNKVVLDATVSSQFISALLLIAPGLPDGLTIEIEGNPVSKPYIDLTIDCMKRAGVNVLTLEQKLVVPAKQYQSLEKIEIESDWSAATFLYALVAVSENSNIYLPNLRLESLQGDRVTAYLFEFLGVRSKVENNGIHLTNLKGFVPKIKVDFTAIPDMFPAIAAVCAILKIQATFTGIKNLKIKESNRLLAMKENLMQAGVDLNIESEEKAFLSFNDNKNEVYHFKSFNDHRIAMACSIFALHNDIVIDDETVVKKSFAKYWETWKGLGMLNYR